MDNSRLYESPDVIQGDTTVFSIFLWDILQIPVSGVDPAREFATVPEHFCSACSLCVQTGGRKGVGVGSINDKMKENATVFI